MNIYTTPYVYLIGWTDANKSYIGCQYHANANPKDLWTTYFTSSKEVLNMREEHGEPDVIRVLKTFSDRDAAYTYETKILRRLNARKHPRLLNRQNNDGLPITKGHLTEDHKSNIGKSNSKAKNGRALEACRENAKKGAEGRRGTKDSLEVRKKRAESLSNTLTGVDRPYRRKAINVDGTVYYGLAAVAEQYGIHTATVRNRINSSSYPNWSKEWP